MHCFRHAPVAAVGICKHCQKGLCPDCLVDLGSGIACKGACEDSLNAINALVARNVRAAGGLGLYFTTLIYGMFGSSFLVWALMAGTDFLFIVAGAFLVGSVLSFVNVRRHRRPVATAAAVTKPAP